ncbi:uncharacterized protein TNCV_2363211 [Trichonephila clavipes]|nr:uncharacterized protein TNCV_2363211 [Trichonephila clavipes]
MDKKRSPVVKWTSQHLTSLNPVNKEVTGAAQTLILGFKVYRTRSDKDQWLNSTIKQNSFCVKCRFEGVTYSIFKETSKGTATAGSDVVQSGRPIFDDFFQHLWPYIGNNTANVVFQMVKRLWLYPHRPMTLHSPKENSLAVLNHNILEANPQVQNVKLGGHPTCLSINRLWHELCDMLRRLVGTTAPGHHDCSIQE